MPKNNTLNHFLINSKTTLKKSGKQLSWPWKLSKTTLLEGQNFDLHIDYLGHLASFRAENTPKSGPVKAKNNAQTTSKQLQNNFQKVKRKQLF